MNEHMDDNDDDKCALSIKYTNMNIWIMNTCRGWIWSMATWNVQQTQSYNVKLKRLALFITRIHIFFWHHNENVDIADNKLMTKPSGSTAITYYKRLYFVTAMYEHIECRFW